MSYGTSQLRDPRSFRAGYPPSSWTTCRLQFLDIYRGPVVFMSARPSSGEAQFRRRLPVIISKRTEGIHRGRGNAVNSRNLHTLSQHRSASRATLNWPHQRQIRKQQDKLARRPYLRSWPWYCGLHRNLAPSKTFPENEQKKPPWLLLATSVQFPGRASVAVELLLASRDTAETVVVLNHKGSFSRMCWSCPWHEQTPGLWKSWWVTDLRDPSKTGALPTNSVKDSLHYISQHTLDNNMIIVVDFNIWLDVTSDPDVQEFTRILKSVNFVQHVEDLAHIDGPTLDLLLKPSGQSCVIDLHNSFILPFRRLCGSLLSSASEGISLETDCYVQEIHDHRQDAVCRGHQSFWLLGKSVGRCQVSGWRIQPEAFGTD